MREVLFRGKSLKTGEWIEGSLIKGIGHYDNKSVVYIYSSDTKIDGRGSIDNYYGEEVDPGTVGQFVGKFVTTGVNVLHYARIFEGDILQFLISDWPEDAVQYRRPVEYSIRKGVVTYEEELGEFRLRLWKNGEYWKRVNLWEYGIRRLDIIGNIHDNSELLHAN